jgi:hypothetical protein
LAATVVAVLGALVLLGALVTPASTLKDLAQDVTAAPGYHGWTVEDTTAGPFDVPGIAPPVQIMDIYKPNPDPADIGLPIGSTIRLFSWRTAADAEAFAAGFVSDGSYVHRCGEQAGRFRVVVALPQVDSPELESAVESSNNC